MAVLCEAISVIVRLDRAVAALGGVESFFTIVPNRTLCIDNELARIGFMSSQDAKSFVDSLEQHGLAYIKDGRAIDLVVVDQQAGPMVACDWLEFGAVEIGDDRVSAARLAGSSQKQLFTPENWSYEGSLSQTFGFVPTGGEKSLKFLRREGGVDIYLNPMTEREVFVGRTTPKES